MCVVGAVVGENGCRAAHVHFVQLRQYGVSGAPIVIGAKVGIFGYSESQGFWIKGNVFKNGRNVEAHGQ